MLSLTTGQMGLCTREWERSYLKPTLRYGGNMVQVGEELWLCMVLFRSRWLVSQEDIICISNNPRPSTHLWSPFYSIKQSLLNSQSTSFETSLLTWRSSHFDKLYTIIYLLDGIEIRSVLLVFLMWWWLLHRLSWWGSHAGRGHTWRGHASRGWGHHARGRHHPCG